MPQHVIIDGSNLATEGRTLPSLKQLKEAVESYRSDHPDALITVVVDATFGHRIDAKEVPEFEREIETNSFVAPPAGAVGRGDGFVLSIAQKANASILSNDSYQEFHGEYPWLFDDGRLIGGKPVPHVGWVFVNRTPVRGPLSRRSIKEQKMVDKSPNRTRSRRGESAASVSANGPMPVPKAPPPGAVLPGPKSKGAAAAVTAESKDAGRDADSRGGAPKNTNDLLTFLSFVEHHPVGAAVTAVVESYSSHGAYVAIGDAKGYVPLRSMGDPAPRSAREVMALGETVTLVVSAFGPAKRSIDLATPAMAPAATPTKPAKAARAKKGAAAPSPDAAEVAAITTAAVEAAAAQASTASAARAPRGRAAKKAATATPSKSTASPSKPVADTTSPAEPTPPSKRAAKSASKPRAAKSTPAPTPPAAATEPPSAVLTGSARPAKRATKTAPTKSPASTSPASTPAPTKAPAKAASTKAAKTAAAPPAPSTESRSTRGRRAPRAKD